MTTQSTIAFIGGGNMTRSLVGGLLADGYPAERITVTEPEPDRRQALADDLGVTVTGDNVDAAANAGTVVLAVKPQVIHEVAEQIGGSIADSGALVISIAAGVRIGDIERWLGGSPAVVRTMPNTPALVQSGATALVANARVTEGQRNEAESLLRAVGLTQWLEDERLMDAVTAVSGSGPAYFFLLMEALEEAAVEQGLEREAARLLTLETAIGAAKMALESSEPPARLRERVTSPGGTTEQALRVLEEGNMRELMGRAVTAAARRAQELGTMLGER